MAGGPIFPYSVYIENSEIFSNVHSGAGAGGSEFDAGFGVEASLGSDANLHLRFQVPPSLPTGTCKLVARAIANATTGDAKINPKWVSVTSEEDPSSATLNAEGTTTITWSSGDDDVYKESKITLDADTPTAGEVMVMNVVFETSSWTLAQVSTWQFFVIWE